MPASLKVLHQVKYSNRKKRKYRHEVCSFRIWQPLMELWVLYSYCGMTFCLLVHSHKIGIRFESSIFCVFFSIFEIRLFCQIEFDFCSHGHRIVRKFGSGVSIPIGCNEFLQAGSTHCMFWMHQYYKTCLHNMLSYVNIYYSVLSRTVRLTTVSVSDQTFTPWENSLLSYFFIHSGKGVARTAEPWCPCLSSTLVLSPPQSTISCNSIFW